MLVWYTSNMVTYPTAWIPHPPSETHIERMIKHRPHAYYSLTFPRELFLRSICAVYAAAFASIATQIPGLYGDDGLEPVHVYLARLKAQNPRLDTGSLWIRMWTYPTLVWVHEELSWPPALVMQVLAVVGMAASLLGVVCSEWRTTPALAVVWFMYLSIVQCGQTFMQFQWDSFLLEVGFLAMWLAPWWRSHAHHVFDTPAAIVWTLRFLFFKFMLMSGAVKIQSRCPTWLGLTALNFHVATQPLPLPLAWYAHQLPPFLLSLGVAATLLFEGPWTFFILAPSLAVRKFSAVMQILLQIMIMLTGNYNFFNILTIIMAVAMLDTRREHSINTEESLPSGGLPRLLAGVDAWWHRVQQSTAVGVAATAIATGYCVYSFNEAFVIGYDSTVGKSSWESMLSVMWIRFTPTVEETQVWIARLLPVSIGGALVIIVSSALWQFVVFIAVPGSALCASQRLVRLLYLVSTTVIAMGTFTSSALTLSILDRPFQHSLPPTVYELYDATSHFRITSAYGLFRTMTGVATHTLNGRQTASVARPEIIIEGTNDNGTTWKPYHFQYKPGDEEAPPRTAVPFQPRLDWQMWFAALGDYHGAPWVVHLVDKLLKGSRDVKALLDSTRDPFPLDPPQAIRAQLYLYDFTRTNTSWNRAIPTAVIVNATGSIRWWSRTFDKEYLPALEQGNPSLEAFVQHHFGPVQARSQDACAHARSPLNIWSCRQAQALVAIPLWSSVLLALGCALVAGHTRSVAIFRSATQSPKSKIE